ncbi:energy transducer TonB [Pandoraea pneumonica]|uniref:Energy transducer TonB n=1 Tax=Pandoraea pneumonica TaxID=2508299 RepID=A0A5E4W5F5_9BURK|nr:energy transducer TonB [Pandoraea pneumonica]VVE19858.1 energy transducer TonB [Pandoraea pneumonica]
MSTVPPTTLALTPSRDPLTSPRAIAIAVAIVAVHLAALIGLSQLRNEPEKATIVPTVFSATIIPPQVAPTPPQPTPPKPTPEPPKPKVAPPPPKPRVQPENAITQKAEPVAPPQQSEPVKDTAPPAPPAPPTPAPAAAPPGRVEGLKIECPDPPLIYPSMSRRNAEEGTTTLRLVIGANGRVTSAEVTKSSGFPRLDKAAIESANKMRCTPAMQNGRAVETTAVKAFGFNLNN